MCTTENSVQSAMFDYSFAQNVKEKIEKVSVILSTLSWMLINFDERSSLDYKDLRGLAELIDLYTEKQKQIIDESIDEAENTEGYALEFGRQILNRIKHHGNPKIWKDQIEYAIAKLQRHIKIMGAVNAKEAVELLNQLSKYV